MEDYLIEKATQGQTTYMIIRTGMFLDFLLEKNILSNFTDGQPVSIFDGSDIPMSVTVSDMISEAVANALLRKDQAANQYCLIQTTAVTQSQLLGYAREVVPDRKFEVVEVDTLKEEREAEERRRKGEEPAASPSTFSLRNSLRQGNRLFRETANEMLGE